MQLDFIDWSIIFGFFAISLVIGAVVSRQAGKSSADFFLSGRNMPWWLLGFSMVATTFAADTPGLVTNIVRENGVAGNWVWWAFLLTGMLTVFVYAKLWRRSGITTDLEFYELRYSGKPAAFLRGFRALYLGVFFNIIIMANVSLAAIKIGHVMLGLDPAQTIVIAATVAVIFSAMGGLKGVLLTDFLLFIIAMVGSIGAAIVALQQADIGGMAKLITHPNVQDKMAMLPAFDLSTTASRDLLMTLLVIPLSVQWWSVWYPGAEPGGGGYIAQRMLAAKDEKHAIGATLFFNVAHYALRPWPWIIVALASLVVFPDNASLQLAYPDMPADQVKGDLAYPAMLAFLPHGLLGLVVASLIAAFMSTISTHLNWGSSYIVNDFYQRFVRPDAEQKELVRVGRLSTVLMMVFAGILALFLKDAYQGFEILLQIGAGTGLLFILRWFWWRINPYSEIVAMVVSFMVALWAAFAAPEDMPSWVKLSVGVGITTVAWILATLVTPADDEEKLRSFYRLVHPGGLGWKRVLDKAAADGVPLPKDGNSHIGLGVACMLVGCLGVYSALFATGYYLYGQTTNAIILTVVAVIAAGFLATMWSKITAGDQSTPGQKPDVVED
ncbi:Sodium/glucose cotransporter [Symmachiella macrocystis]|uniref:Sodium/glucose cotransporter n=1 Tax=Symmachiella macrocystis TaxID=2527985 RepID=A0A5C6BVG0_9PLAN|nr:sodium:solute symporter family protein [Symmachiella macrocystis]TWU14674.1 Sodium/glucose cotransporter [Symmachiella macrocystis]